MLHFFKRLVKIHSNPPMLHVYYGYNYFCPPHRSLIQEGPAVLPRHLLRVRLHGQRGGHRPGQHDQEDLGLHHWYGQGHRDRCKGQSTYRSRFFSPRMFRNTVRVLLFGTLNSAISNYQT